MKLDYVCECCDVVVHSIEVDDPGEIPSALTGKESQHIINMSGSGDHVVLTTLCDECLEDMYGGVDNTYFSGPVLN